MSQAATRRSILQRDGVGGSTIRMMFMLGLLVLALLFVMVCRWQQWAFTAVDSAEAGWIFLGIAASMVLAMLFSEYPEGDDFVFWRLGLATFCRTGLPLMVVLAIARYSGCQVGTESRHQPFIMAALFYGVGHFCGLILTALYFNSDLYKKKHD